MLRSSSRALGALLTLVVASLLAAAPAAAHTELTGSSPEEGATVDTLDEVRLEFSSTLLEIGAEMTLVDGAGAEHVLVPEMPEPMVVTAAVEQDLAAGPAELQWRIVAEDGHPIEGTIAFEYAPAVAPEPSASASAEPSPSATASAVATPQPSASPVLLDGPVEAEPEPATPTWLWIVLGVAAVGAGATAVVLVMRRGTPGE